MNVFVTGATGFIGIQLVKRLVEEGNTVHALYRSESKADLIRMEGVKLFRGDILDEDSLRQAMQGCSQAYHAAAFAAVWSKDPDLVFRLNVNGSLNVIRLAEEAGISRIVVTSTAGILGPSETDPVNETTPPPDSFFTPYEASKFQLEQILAERKERSPEVIIVNPTRVYGPGYLSESNGVTRMIGRYLEGKWRLIPGNGRSTGNYVFVEDVVTGHLLAMENGIPGERYVLGGEDISYNQLFGLVREISGIYHRLMKVPFPFMLLTASILSGFARLTGNPPMITPGLVRKFNHNWLVSSTKARETLGYDPKNAREGIKRTILWLNNPD